MAEETYSFTTARTRLEEIVTQVRKKDTSLEKSLDLLEEGVRLANACTEMIDQADWVVDGAEGDPTAGVPGEQGEAAAPYDHDAELPQAAAGVAVDAIEVGDGASGPEVDEQDDGLADAWSDDVALADELGADDDPSSDER